MSCYDGHCETTDGTTYTTCVPNCDGKACGDYDGCGSRCLGPCDSGEFCSIALAKCTNQCSAASCPDGCCEGSTCVRAQNDSECGAHGAFCSSCPANGPACVPIPGFPPEGSLCQACDSTTCPNGCCTADGHCDDSGVDASCGYLGAGCVDCTLDGSVCGYPGVCADCSPDCDGKSCGDSDGCGGTCAAECATGLTCVINNQDIPSGCQPCNGATCQWGCCDADGKCQGGGSQHACGAQGGACQDCGTQGCDWDFFNAQCGDCNANCPFPIPGQTYCVANGCGGICPGSSCDQGTCSIGSGGWAQCSFPGFCDPYMCGGCCDNQGNCHPGNLPMACGHQGVYCVDCVAQGTSCDVATKTCDGCTPNCTNKWCGASDGCGGKCSGPDATCQGGAVCTVVNTTPQCTCPTAGEQLCYDPQFNLGCVDTSSDPNRCGTCYTVCPAGIDCVDGKCDCPTGSHLCTAPDATKSCTNLATDPNNCGNCNVVCPGTPCDDGACGSCGPGETACSGTCADLMNDEAHCGSCTNTCPVGVQCVAGECDCGGGLTGCGGACTDTQTDESNCGSCFHTCPAGVTCSTGMCTCPGGATLCGNACTNTDVDPQHCGSCSHPCSPGQSCVAGNCI